MARTMLNENDLPKYFWAEAVNTSCYVLNRVLIRPNLNKTPYELWKGRKPNIGYFRVFGCKCFILNTKDNLGKFDSKSDISIFLGYSTTSKVYRVFNKRTLVVEESMHVSFDETYSPPEKKSIEDDDVVGVEQNLSDLKLGEIPKDGHQDQPQKEEKSMEGLQNNNGNSLTLPLDLKFKHAHPKDQILGDPLIGVKTRASLRNICNNLAFLSQIEPKSFKDSENDNSWIMAMQEELNQFERSDV